MKKIVLTTLLAMIASGTLQANVTLGTASFQEKIEVNKSGEKLRTWVKAEKVIPGSIVRYVNSLENKGRQNVSKLVVKNPIPKNMEYVADTASCQGSCTVTYSIDGGKSFKKVSELFIGKGEERHLARPAEYTDIRWVLNALNAKSKSSVEYKAQLK